ncbi:HAMP domain-containing sensor histidine kinase [Reyranella sp. CPCC 100927]|uniref:sensor histidine kinase n=1 Tax=Reyranella sp. CPCC 100927 TaxID=2599616 RepID=UPI0011B520DC|nr:HAMP domain-containing sensor histidine kinase [Reyranella sp. CPCC 100927]TWT14056.1 HAMP domain-containing histidine kinase [Reyranella sp. CPCC 100927]
MSRRHSITVRAATTFAGSLVAVMAGGFLIVVSYLLNFGEDREMMGPLKAASLLQAATSRNAAGQLTLEPNGELAAFIAAHPKLWYVISDGDTTLTHGVMLANPGHDGAWQGRLRLAEFKAAGNKSVEADGAVSVAVITPTRVGPVSLEVGGISQLPFLEMILFTIGDASNLYSMLAFILFAMAVAHLVVLPRLIARPVSRVARAAEAIDGLPAGRRLPDASAPKELVPLVDAFNRALQRIDDAALSQRSFLSNAAHELRTPLTRLRTKLEAVPDPAQRQDLTTDVQNLSSIVTTLLHLARLSGQPHAFQPVDLVLLCRTTVAELVPQALAAAIDIEVTAPDGPVVVRGVETAIRSAVANLVRNAVRHAGTCRHVAVVVVVPGEVRVIDHGPGIPVEGRERLFQPFARGATTDDDGVGLGLAIVAQVMTMHGGAVHVSDTPGGGATITLDFPESRSIPRLERTESLSWERGQPALSAPKGPAHLGT